MLNATQQYYLNAMGIDYWVRRSPAVDSAAPSSLPAADRAVDIASLDWDDLQSAVAGCTRCSLAAGRTQTVFGIGDRNADCMVIGEAPGAEEDRRGEPFVGRAGQLLTAMLFAIGLDRAQVYIANILKCRPPNNRDPHPDEVASCAAYLQRQIALVGPKIIVAVGRIAAQNLLNTDMPIGRMRGRRFSYGTEAIPVVVTYHPAYLLRSPAQKRKAWEDLLLVKSVLAGQS